MELSPFPQIRRDAYLARQRFLDDVVGSDNGGGELAERYRLRWVGNVGLIAGLPVIQRHPQHLIRPRDRR